MKLPETTPAGGNDSPETREQGIFLEALDHADPADRNAFLDRACGDDAPLRGAVDRLLHGHGLLGAGFMEGPATVDAEPDTVHLIPLIEKPGTVIDSYRLLRKIGEGGHGVVYEAEQTAPVRRRVALKVIKPGMDTGEVIARFEAERQALALMDHPNIAHVYDAGATAGGRPYFVMELIKGVPITRFCDEQKLTVRERLALFIDVCNAVQHAHQKGLIHRDLKPSNVLVSLQGDKAQAKVIDFGVAKATGGALTERTLFTADGQFIGTPVNMSPEQASGGGLDVDTRSDIYSLGTILYELLTGLTALDPRRLREVGYGEMARIIREVEPQRPSLRITSLGTALEDVAKGRAADTEKLHRLLRGDLDWITLKALEKDRARRYETANAFALDIQRYLDDEAVRATPPSTAYRMKKFTRRHKGALAAAAAVLVALVGGGIGITVNHLKAERHRLAAEGERIEKERVGLDRDKERIEADRQRELVVLGQKHQVEMREHDSRVAHTEAVRRWERDDVPGAIAYAAQALKLDPENAAASTLLGNLLVKGARSGPIQVLQGHTDRVVKALFSPDGKILATASRYDGESTDRTVRLWDAHTGAELHRFRRETKTPIRFAFSPDSRLLVRNDHVNCAKVWDVETGQEIAELSGDGKAVRAVAFSPDGSRLATSSLCGVTRIWDTATWETVHVLEGQTKAVNDVKFSPDGTRLASSSDDGTARVFDAATGKLVSIIEGDGAEFTLLAFSPDGATLAVGSNSRLTHIYALDVETGAVKWTRPRGGRGGFLSIAFTPDGQRLVVTHGVEIIVLDSRTGEVSFSTERRNTYSPASVSPDGRLLAAGHSDGVLRIWDVVNGARMSHRQCHVGAIEDISWSPDSSRIATVGSDQTPRIWHATTGNAIEVFEAGVGREDWQNEGAFNSDGTRIVTTGKDHVTRIWDTSSGQQLAAVEGSHSAKVQYLPGDRLLRVFTQSGMVEAIRADGSDNEVFRFDHGGEIVQFALSADKSLLATAGRDNVIRLWDAGTGDLECTVTVTKRRRSLIRGVAFTPDGGRLAACFDNEAAIWDARSGEREASLQEHTDVVNDIVFSADGAHVATASTDRSARIWSVDTGDLISEVLDDQPLRNVLFDPLGERLATLSFFGVVRLWDAQSWQQVATLRGHSAPIDRVAFSPNGVFLATGSEDQTTRLWDPVTGTTVAIEDVRKGGGKVAFSPDGASLASYPAGSNARIWQPFPSGGPPEPWVFEILAPVVSGLIVDESGWLRPVFAVEWREWHSELQKRAAAVSNGDTDPFSRVLTWHFEDARMRTISPFSAMRTPDWVEGRVGSGRLWNSHEAYGVSPGHPLIHFAASTGAYRFRFRADYALARLLDPENVVVYGRDRMARYARVAAEMLEAQKDPKRAAVALAYAEELEKR